MQKIIPHLWFDKEAKEAAAFYVGVFEKLGVSKVTNVTTMTGTPSGDCDIVEFTLAGQDFRAISAGPFFKFNSAISFFVIFDNEKEIDAAWGKLLEGGKILMPYAAYPWARKYGWVQDKYGLTWQVSLSDGNKDTAMTRTQKITPLFMFTGNVAGKVKEAIESYTKIFPDSRVETVVPYEKADGDGQAFAKHFIKHSRFTLAGENFMAMETLEPSNVPFNEAVSFIINCDTQEEIDAYWSKLSKIPAAEQCGWCADTYGVSWQIVPTVLGDMMGSGDSAKVARVTQAFLKMKKFDIKKLEEAYAG